MRDEIAGWIATGCEVMADGPLDSNDTDPGIIAAAHCAVDVYAVIQKHGIARVLSALAAGADAAHDVLEEPGVPGRARLQRELREVSAMLLVKS